MTDTRTPAPALTDEQIDMKRVQVRAHDVDALCEAGDDYAEAYGSFGTWLAAVEARAARWERARIAAAIRARRDRLHSDAEGHRAAYEIALADLGAGDDDTD